MTPVDGLIVAVIGLSAVVSLWRGFVKEAISLLSWIAAFAVAIAMTPQLSQLLAETISTAALRMLLAFLLLFFSTLLVGGLINRLLASLLKISGLSGTDRLLGMVFGVFRGVIVVLAFLVIVPPVVAVEDQIWWRESLLIPQYSLLQSWALATFGDISQWQPQWLQR